MFSNFWTSIIWRGMQIEESVIRRPFFWWLSCSTDVIFFISKVSSKIVNNSWLWSGISQDVEAIRNGEIFCINDKIYWPRTVFFRHVNWSRDLIMYMFPIFFLLSGLSYRVIWKWRCDVYSLFANTQSFATPESDLTIWKNESKSVMSAWPVAYFWCKIDKLLSQWGQYNRKRSFNIGFNQINWPLNKMSLKTFVLSTRPAAE